MSPTSGRSDRRPVLVLGGTGKTGRRVVARLRAAGHEVRVASRSGDWHFDWQDPGTWDTALEGAGAAYVVPFDPEPLVPALVERAVAAGLDRIVLLSGRGIDDPDYVDELVLSGNTLVAAEEAVRDSGLEWTVLRPGWFSQNFDEGFLADLVRSGEVRLPTGDGAVSFTDAEDIAEVVAAALTEPGHHGRTYELSGPRALTVAEALAEISSATGRTVRYVPLSTEEFVAELADQGVAEEEARALASMLSPIPRGKDEHLSDGVQRALGREPRDFAAFAADAAGAGAWERSLPAGSAWSGQGTGTFAS
ncbi:SDR family oxidoreductase [Nocardiopsis ganjiahuensis]|uniref:SDR family oxidoreductase n=1 Tax=Nocardiopsis ganjiahuensis TaxID=239984 RepID=UPI00068589D1|nr:SDR family oxidoreductase [Nocardiopsis ganjiahuensis]